MSSFDLIVHAVGTQAKAPFPINLLSLLNHPDQYTTLNASKPSSDAAARQGYY